MCDYRGEVKKTAMSRGKGFGKARDLQAAELRLAEAHLRQGRFIEAGDLYHRLLQRLPDCYEALVGLGRVLLQLGRPAGACELLAQAVAQRPDDALVRLDLGHALAYLDRPAEAEGQFRAALATDPTLVAAHIGLGNVLLTQGLLNKATTCYRQALALAPEDARVWSNLASALQVQGEPEAAYAGFARALALAPEAGVHSNLLLALQYRPDLTPARLAEAQAAFASSLAGLPRFQAPAQRLDPGRSLRLGYISPDFRGHACAGFIEPLLAHHDRQHFQVFCYADVAAPDAVTARLRPLASTWRDIAGATDEAVARQIRADSIDILVDLAGHTAGNRLAVLARKPAPVQVSWLGYPGSTGLAEVDYRLSDAWLTPEATSEPFSEQLWRLDRPCHCWRPPAEAPPIRELPALSTGRITFGSFNNLTKLSEATVALWATVLKQVPESRLLVKSAPLADEAVREQLLKRFLAHGILAERLVCVGAASGIAEHLGWYDQVDIALDSHPYNGCTTTLEALWMGVPVVSLAGERTAARYGLSLLPQVGLAALAVETRQAFVQQACALAADLAALAALRRELRARLAASVLRDEAGFARTLEAAYRQMWQRWCLRSGGATNL